MCYTCGCRKPYDDKGDPKNITEKNFMDAGKSDAVGSSGKLDAKRNMMELLQSQMEKDEMENPREEY